MPAALPLPSALKAATAGAVAVWVMDRFDWFAFDHGNPQARRRTEAVRPGGMDPAHALAAKAAAVVGTHLKPAPPHRHPAGLTVHYAVPMALAMIYDIFRRQRPPMNGGGSAFMGSLYGVATFLVLDEVVNPLLGLAARPDRYPWQRHARELGAHMIYGLVIEAAMHWFDSLSKRAQAAPSVAHLMPKR